MPDLAGEGGAYESGSVDDVLEVSQSPEGFLFLGMMERTLVDFPRGGGGDLRLEEHADLETCSCAELADDNGG